MFLKVCSTGLAAGGPCAFVVRVEITVPIENIESKAATESSVVVRLAMFVFSRESAVRKSSDASRAMIRKRGLWCFTLNA
jgi:hypothetical protein